MSFQPGRMGMAEGIGLTFMVTFSRIFLSTPALSVAAAKNLAWVTGLIAFSVDAMAFFALLFIQNRVKGDFYSITERLLTPAGAWLVAGFYTVLFILDAALVLRQFAENTLLTALPFADFQVVIYWYIFFSAILVYFGIEGMARAAYLVLPWIVASVGIVLVLLSPFYETYNLTPWQGAGIGEALKRGLLFAGLNVGGLLLPVFRPQFQTLKTQKTAFLLGIGGSSVLRSIMVVCFILAFGVAEGSEKTLPFFEMSRLVYLSRYIQRIESLFIIAWVIVGILSIAIDIYMVLYIISRPLKLPSLRPLIPAMSMIIVCLAALPPDVITVVSIDFLVLTTVFNAGAVLVPGLLVIAFFIRRQRRRPSCRA